MPSRIHAAFRSVLRIVFAIFLLAAFALGAFHLRNGWQSIWLKQAAVPHKQTFFPVDPTLAKDPSVASAKIVVVGPLANAMKDSGLSDSAEDAGGEAPQTTPSGTPSESRLDTVAPAPSKADLANRFHHLQPLRLFHGRMIVKGYADLPFQVPPYASFPRLTGAYKRLGNPQSQSAGLTLVTDEQFKDFLSGTLGEALSSSDAPDGFVDVRLKPTLAQSQKYHLLVRGPKAGARVEADFTINFE